MPKRGAGRDIPPPLELECLKALWTLGEANVKDVREVLTARRNLAYTTVMTVLDRLVKKGVAGRRKQGRSFLYAPLTQREELRRLAVQELLDAFFDGSREQLLAYLTGTAEQQEAPQAPPPAVPLDATLL